MNTEIKNEAKIQNAENHGRVNKDPKWIPIAQYGGDPDTLWSAFKLFSDAPLSRGVIPVIDVCGLELTLYAARERIFGGIAELASNIKAIAEAMGLEDKYTQ